MPYVSNPTLNATFQTLSNGWRFWSTYWDDFGSTFRGWDCWGFPTDAPEPPYWAYFESEENFNANIEGAVCNVVPPNAFVHGLLQGTLQQLFFPPSTGTAHCAGLVCMMDELNLAPPVGGRGYAAVLDASDQHIDLVKLVAGFDATTWEVLATSDSASLWADGSHVVAGVSWDARPATITAEGGPVFTVQAGPMGTVVGADYSLLYEDLADVPGLVGIVDTVAPYTTTVIESIAAYRATGLTPVQVFFDYTRLYG